MKKLWTVIAVLAVVAFAGWIVRDLNAQNSRQTEAAAKIFPLPAGAVLQTFNWNSYAVVVKTAIPLPSQAYLCDAPMITPKYRLRVEYEVRVPGKLTEQQLPRHYPGILSAGEFRGSYTDHQGRLVPLRVPISALPTRGELAGGITWSVTEPTGKENNISFVDAG